MPAGEIRVNLQNIYIPMTNAAAWIREHFMLWKF
jgi:hypothetical protein